MSGRVGNGAMPPQPDLTEIRKQLFTRGYKILPNRGKVPVIKGWSDPDYLARELADSGKGTVLEKIERWLGRFPDAHSTGVWLWNGLRVIDIDIDDPELAEAALGVVREFSPDIADRAPKRLGAVPRIALFARAPDNEEGKKLFNDKGDLIHVVTTTFNRIGSHRYRRPDEGEDAPTHAIEIFGGEPTAKGKCSRQFGVYGPHSYNGDGTVAREYAWAADRPALHEIDLTDLPTLSCEVAYKIAGAFEAMAKAAGWVGVETGPDKRAGRWSFTLVDDPSMLFNDNHGGVGMQLSEVIENCPVDGSRYTVASSFIPGDTGSNVTKCLVGWSDRLNCITIWNSEEDVVYAPADKAVIDDDGSMDRLREQLCKLRDDGGGSGKVATAAERPQEDEADAQGGAPPRLAAAAAVGGNRGVTLVDFWAYMPRHLYIFAPTGDMWPAASINARLPKIPVVKKDGMQAVDSEGKPRSMSPSVWLDRHRPVEQMTWAPGEPPAIIGRLVSEGGWIDRPGVATFNLYRPPVAVPGNAAKAGRWIELVKRIYPDDAEHIITFCAQRIQFPAVKINHGLVLTGSPGIGKDTLLEPLKLGVGPWNFKEVSPTDITDKFNDYMRSVVLRISEARDLGEINRYAFYERTKTILAAPPDVTRVNGKYIPQHHVVNVAGVILTTNYPQDGLYLPPDDRRHHVAGTEVTKEDFDADFWSGLWDWYRSGGLADVVAYLSEYDLSKFDPKKPPEKTEAFWRMVDGGTAPEVSELNDALDRLGRPDANGKPHPPAAVTLAMVLSEALGTGRDLYDWLSDRRNRRAIPHRFASCGYVPVRNSAREDGLWLIAGKRQVVYGRQDITPDERFKAAEELKVAEDHKAAELSGKLMAAVGRK